LFWALFGPIFYGFSPPPGGCGAVAGAGGAGTAIFAKNH
jgi:hypothetical protein